jgi:hypothetical protein
MTSHLAKVENDSDKYASLILRNKESLIYAAAYEPNGEEESIKDNPPIAGQDKLDSIQTKKGLLFFYDQNSTIHGQWEGAGSTKFADDFPDGQKFRIEVKDDGNVAFHKEK